MEKIKKIYKKYCLKEILVLFFVSAFMLLLFYGKSESFLVDVGREAYIPWQMLNGEVLYKDIFNVYGPLSYQINSLMYMLFGTKLSTMYIAGYLNAFFILVLTFFVTKIFTGRKFALYTSFLVMGSCLFIKTFFNFVFPYSYAAVYALSGYLLSVLSFLLYLKHGNKKFLYSSFICAGFCFANKIEYVPYFILLFLSLFFLKPKIKDIFVCIPGFFVFPAASFSVLLLQGAEFSDFWNAFLLVKNMVKTPALAYFYKDYGLYWNSENFVTSMKVLGCSVLALMPVFLLFAGLNYLDFKFLKNKLTKTIFNFAMIVFCFFISVQFFKYFLLLDNKFFCWLGIVSLFILAGFCCYAGFEFYKKRKINKTDIMFLFLILSAVSVSLKGISGITTECYGTFTITALIIPFIIFAVKYLHRILKFRNKKVYYKTVGNICLIIVILFFALNIKKLAQNRLYPIRTDRGLILVPGYIKDMRIIVSYIEKNTKKDDVVVSIPEGVMINFLTGRKSHNKYYYLIPVNSQLFGVENIVSDFKKHPPDYFIVNNVSYSPYNVTHICSYAKALCDFIEANYDLKLYTNSELEFYIYKLKSEYNNLQTIPE